MTVSDADALQKEGSSLTAVSYIDRQVAQVVYGSHNWSTSINGTTPPYFTIRDWSTSSGQLFADADVWSGRKVALLLHQEFHEVAVAAVGGDAAR